jgi:hypothetical protein
MFSADLIPWTLTFPLMSPATLAPASSAAAPHTATALTANSRSFIFSLAFLILSGTFL